MHLQLIQNKPVSEHLSSQRVSNFKIVLLFVKCKRFYKTLIWHTHNYLYIYFFLNWKNMVVEINGVNVQGHYLNLDFKIQHINFLWIFCVVPLSMEL